MAPLSGKIRRSVQQTAYSAGLWRPAVNIDPPNKARVLEFDAAKGTWVNRGWNKSAAWYRERERLLRRGAARAKLFGPAKRALQQAGLMRPPAGNFSSVNGVWLSAAQLERRRRRKAEAEAARARAQVAIAREVAISRAASAPQLRRSPPVSMSRRRTA